MLIYTSDFEYINRFKTHLVPCISLGHLIQLIKFFLYLISQDFMRFRYCE